MNIPEKLKVGGMTYTVNITDRLVSGSGYAAEVIYNEQQINVRPSCQQKMEADFLHEMIHTIFVHMGLTDHDERHVDAIAQALHMIITDNPGIFATEATKPEPSSEDDDLAL